MSERINKINELIKQTVSEILLKELSLKEGVFITIVKVDTSRDLRYTRIFISVFPEKDFSYALKTLEKNIYEIQKEFNKKLSIKPLPRIEFRSDFTEAKAAELEEIFNQLKNSKN